MTSEYYKVPDLNQLQYRGVWWLPGLSAPNWGQFKSNETFDLWADLYVRVLTEQKRAIPKNLQSVYDDAVTRYKRMVEEQGVTTLMPGKELDDFLTWWYVADPATATINRFMNVSVPGEPYPGDTVPSGLYKWYLADGMLDAIPGSLLGRPGLPWGWLLVGVAVLGVGWYLWGKPSGGGLPRSSAATTRRLNPERRYKKGSRRNPVVPNVGVVAVMNTASLEPDYAGKPPVIYRRVKITDYYFFDQYPRVSVKILDGPEKGRVVTGQSLGQLESQYMQKPSKKKRPKKDDVGTENPGNKRAEELFYGGPDAEGWKITDCPKRMRER